MNLSNLQKLMTLGLTTEQMAGVIEVLTEELAPVETMRKKAAARQLRYRQRDSNVTVGCDSDGAVTPQPSRVEYNINNPKLDIKNKSLSPSLSLSKPEPSDFEAFWSIYPKRDGSMDRKGAIKAFGAAIRRVPLTTIIEGAQHFAEAMTARGKVGTEFIPQPRTWLNGDRWNDRYDAATPTDNNEAQWLAILQKHAAPTGS